MKGIGWTLIFLSVVLVIWACATPTSIHSDMEYIAGVGLQEPKDVLNIGLLQNQMMLFQAGLAAFLSGTVSVCVAELRDAMCEAGTAKYSSLFDTEKMAAAVADDSAAN